MQLAYSPLIFDIKRHALEDGPGIRTTVFFKGCNLRCVWCHNPESIDPSVEIAFYPSQCIACGECAKICPESACSMDTPRRIDRTRCSRCGDCAKACPGSGLRIVGRYYSVDELVDILLRDIMFYEVSRGGITFSGGEPTLFIDYLAAVLKKLKEKGIQTAIQTNGYFQWTAFESKLLDFLDLIMIDLKLANPEEHLNYTGKSNQVILENLERLTSQKKTLVIPRIPLIPQITATTHNLQKLNSILQKFKTHCLILPYNPMGISKWITIGKEIPYDLPKKMMTPNEEISCMNMLNASSTA